MEVPDASGESVSDDDPDDFIDSDHKFHFRYNRRLGMFSNPISSLNFSADGRWFLAGTTLGDVKVYETARWSESARLKCTQPEEPRVITISPTHRWLVAAYPSMLRIYNCKPPWRLEQAIPPMPDPATGEPTEWYCIAFSPILEEVDEPSGRTGHDYFLAGFSTCHMAVMDYSGGWGPDTPKRTRTISHTRRPTSLTYTLDGFWMVCGFECGQVQVWNAFSLTLERTLASHIGRVRDIAMSPKGACFESRFVSCGVDQTLRVWHTSGWVLEQICPDTKADRSGITSCQFSSSGSWLVSIANELVVWRVIVTRRNRMILRIHQRLAETCGAEDLRAARFCSFNDAVAVGSKDGVLALLTKVEGLPREMLADQGAKASQKTSSTPGPVEAWNFDRRSLPRPMKRITPEGVKPVGTPDGSRELFTRGPFRSLSTCAGLPTNLREAGFSTPLSGVPGLGGRFHRSASFTRNLGATGGRRFAGGSPTGAGRELSDADDCSQSPITQNLAALRNLTLAKSTSVPDFASTWNSRRCDEVLRELGVKDSAIGAFGIDKNLERRSSATLPRRRMNNTEPLVLRSEPMEDLPMSRTIQHACRGMVQRISLAPTVIGANSDSRASSKS